MHGLEEFTSNGWAKKYGYYKKPYLSAESNSSNNLNAVLQWCKYWFGPSLGLMLSKTQGYVLKEEQQCWQCSGLPTIIYYRGFPFSSSVFLHCCLRLFIIPWSIDTCKIVYFYWQRLLLFSHFQGRSTGHRGTALGPLCPATSHPSLADVLKSLAKVTEVFVGDQFFQNSRLSELLVWSLCFLILFLCRC